MVSAELFAHMVAYHRENPTQRIGQAYFNGLWEARKDIATVIDGGPDDPFYDDDVLPRFFAAIEQALVNEKANSSKRS